MLATVISGSSAVIADEQIPAFLENISLQQRHVLLGYSTWIDASTDAPYNTDNNYARLPDRIFTTELRSDFTLRNDGPCELSLAPRLRYDSTTGVESGSSDDTDFYLKSGGLHCAIGQAWELRAGRYVSAWGNATFRGPSNPFFVDSGKTDPIRELVGRDTFLVGWRDKGWFLSSMVVGSADERNNQPVPSTAALALRADYTGSSYNAGLVMSRAREEKLRLGGYATWTASKSLIVYGEGTLRQNRGLYPEPSNDTPLGWNYVESNDQQRAAALLGAAYTFKSGWTLTTEALFDEAGYSGKQRDWTELSAIAANDVLSQPPGEVTEDAAQLMGQILNPGLSVQSRRTLFLQLQRSEWANRADFAVRLAWDADQDAADLSTSLTYFMTSRWELLALGLLNSERSVDGRVLDGSLLLGVRAFLQ